MTNAIFQICIGNSLAYEKCIDSAARYCKKYNIIHYVSRIRAFPDQHLMMEKYQLLFFLHQNRHIKRLMYLDADILITPHAKNIFDEYEDFNGLYAYDENDVSDWMDRDPYIKEPNWTINSKGKKQYFNAGLMLFNADHILANAGIFNFKDIPNWDNIWYFGDQTPINYWMMKNKIPFRSIDYSFNRMDLGNYDLTNERYSANFIHYAGPCKYGNGNKHDTIINDYNFLWGNKIDK